ncbi:helix-turn-helix domain-containing protein [Dactylosporangium sucinum]|uniref:HTH cro/C1-type domain-containing protein n=1 Tax=Dactylosporangium sucinum TaxID=1424081 RepID=A0A917TJP9_9ACTN|nr:helix-turn-helix transcriptional regulator [Dactylosporangium sucinum]GGM24848.1 hypothetical protein GCM10007977_027490 [Dactylosporangium sucinum]
MSLGDTPAVARRRVRLAIRDARNAKGYTQGQVADAMDWSLSKVMRIESGEVTISQKRQGEPIPARGAHVRARAVNVA